MADQPRDWDKELAAIDREIAKLPDPRPGQPPTGRTAGAPAAVAAPAAAPVPASKGARAFLGAWVRVLFGAAIALGVVSWPYAHLCGWSLYGYLGAVLVVIVAGVWNILATWKRRMGAAHGVALAVLITGLILAAQVILPRIGYARQALTWMCP
ncbi:MAG TPA: hypothetical protein VFI39_02995 [Gemmatimonadales bacterium]|nr:hypothetical protein [Gemmatimonadales bacterium]